MQLVGSVSRGRKCECSDAVHAQMSWRLLTLGNDSFNLKNMFHEQSSDGNNLHVWLRHAGSDR